MVNIQNDIFRAYDIRGIVGKDIDHSVAYKIARAFGSYLINHKKNTIAISGDVRPSTDILLEYLCRTRQ